MHLYYLDYLASKKGIRLIHRFGCFRMSKSDNYLFLGKFYSAVNIDHNVRKEFPEWTIHSCSYCCGKD